MCQRNKNKLKNQSVSQMFEKLKNEKNVKGIYNLTAQLSGNKTTTTPQHYVQQGRIIAKPVEMANAQLDYFVKKVDKLIENLPTTNRNPLRYLDSALEKWQHKDERPEFNFRDISLTEASVFNLNTFQHKFIWSWWIIITSN